MLFALAFLPMFGIGGLTGLPLGLAPSDIHLHDTYYVIGHFHYVVAPGTIFALFAGIYYWFPKATGRKMNEMLGKIHFWGSFICINVVFMPMFIQGLAGMIRRLYDGGAQLRASHSRSCSTGTSSSAWGAWTLGALPASVHLQFLLEHQVGRDGRRRTRGRRRRSSGRRRRRRRHGNFLDRAGSCTAGPYEYSVPGRGQGLHAAVRAGVA